MTRASAIVAFVLVSGCSGPPNTTTERPPPGATTVGTPPATPAPSARAALLDEYVSCHAQLRALRQTRSRDHHHIGRTTTERDAAQAAVARAHGPALVAARAVLADLEEDLHEAQERYDADRAAVRTSEIECNAIQDQIHALPH